MILLDTSCATIIKQFVGICCDVTFSHVFLIWRETERRTAHIIIVHDPDNIRVSSGWAKDCCYFLIPIYVHFVYLYDNLCTRVA